MGYSPRGHRQLDMTNYTFTLMKWEAGLCQTPNLLVFCPWTSSIQDREKQMLVV